MKTYIIIPCNFVSLLFSVANMLKSPPALALTGRKKNLKLVLKGLSPGAQGSKMSRTGSKGLNVVSNWTFCAEFENQRLTCRTWEVFF